MVLLVLLISLSQCLCTLYYTTADTADSDWSRPYPFFLAHALPGAPDALGEREAWQAEWKWDGIRCQALCCQGRAHLWSRGEELVTDRFPEVAGILGRLPEGTVVDGEIVACRDGCIMPFHDLQRRIGRTAVSRSILRDVPVAMIAYDLLASHGDDVRTLPLAERRALLEQIVAPVSTGHLRLSPVLEGDWPTLISLRPRAGEHMAEGIMLKRLSSPYRAGRVRGDWWKWKVDPRVIDAVLVMSRRGSGRRAGLFTDVDVALHWHPGSRNSVGDPSCLARIAALFRRAELPQATGVEETLDRGDLRLDLKRFSVSWKGKPVPLTLTEVAPVTKRSPVKVTETDVPSRPLSGATDVMLAARRITAWMNAARSPLDRS